MFSIVIIKHFSNQKISCDLFFIETFILEMCQEKCAPQCSFTKFSIWKTFTQFPNAASLKYYAALLNITNPNISEAYSRRNWADLTIKMDSFVVERTTIRAKYELFSIASGFGGLLGLFLGGSLMTIFEILELLLKLTLSIAYFVGERFTLIMKSINKVSSADNN